MPSYVHKSYLEWLVLRLFEMNSVQLSLEAASWVHTTQKTFSQKVDMNVTNQRSAVTL